MSQPARRFSAQAIFRTIKVQSWVVFILILVMVGVEMGLQHTDYAWSKNFLCGGVLAWLGHSIFAYLALRVSGAKYSRQVVNNFYLAQAIKWAVTMAGFAAIFILLKPLVALWVFVGYFCIQLSQMVLLYYFDKHHRLNK